METFLGNLWRLLVQTYNVTASHGFGGCAAAFAVGLILVRYATKLTGRSASGHGRVGPFGNVVIDDIQPAVHGTAKGFGDRMIALFCNLIGSALLIISLLAAANVAMYGPRAPTDLLDRAQSQEPAPQFIPEAQSSAAPNDGSSSSASPAFSTDSATPSDDSSEATTAPVEDASIGGPESPELYFTRLSEFFAAASIPPQAAKPLSRSLTQALDSSVEHSRRSRHVSALSDDGLTHAFVMTAPRKSGTIPRALFCVSQGAKVTLYISYTVFANGETTRKLGKLTFEEKGGRRAHLTEWAAEQRDCDAVHSGLEHYKGLDFVYRPMEMYAARAIN